MILTTIFLFNLTMNDDTQRQRVLDGETSIHDCSFLAHGWFGCLLIQSILDCRFTLTTSCPCYATKGDAVSVDADQRRAKPV